MKTLLVCGVMLSLSCLHVYGALVYGTNLIQNPGAEQGLTGWTPANPANPPEAIAYGTPGFPSSSDPVPPNRGNYFWAGGPGNDFTWMDQYLDVSNAAALIDLGVVHYTISGWQGGKDDQEANAAMGVHFYDETNTWLWSNGTNYNNSAADRGNVTGLYFRPGPLGGIPAGTRTILFQILFMQGASSDGYHDGYIDNVSFIAYNSAVPEPASVFMMIAGLGSLAVFGLQRRLK